MTMTKRVSKAATLLRGKMHRLTRRTNRVSIHHRIGTVVCVIEIVSPGNKSSELKLLDFVSKNLNYLEAGIHILVADILPPTRRDPHGIHQEIWKEIADPDSEVPPRRKPLTLAAYIASDPPEDLEIQAIVKAVAVGDTLPDMPAYLGYNRFVPIPLEATYMSAWNSCPFAMRHLIEHGKLPNDDYD